MLPLIGHRQRYPANDPVGIGLRVGCPIAGRRLFEGRQGRGHARQLEEIGAGVITGGAEIGKIHLADRRPPARPGIEGK